MRDLFDSLTRHVASLTQEGFEALLMARPDVEAAILADVPDGADARVDVYSVVEALVDPDGVAETMVRMTRPELQVLMALSASASTADAAGSGSAAGSLGGGAADRFGGLGYDELIRAGAGSGRTGRVDLMRLFTLHGTPLDVDPQAAREALCRPSAPLVRAQAEEEFDRILGRLVTGCLVWPDSVNGSLRLHDVVPGLLPGPGPAWEAFDPVPPSAEPARWVPPASVDAEAQAAATAALEGAERLLRQIATEPVPLIKAGGVGTREVKRLVRTCGLDEEAIRFWLHVAEGADLVACRDGKLWATPHYDEWIGGEPDLRYAALFTAWMGLPASVLGPFATIGQAGRAPGVLSDASFDGVGDQVRSAVLDLMTACDAGVVADTSSLARALLWRMPLLLTPQDGFDCECEDCRRLTRPNDQDPADDLAGAAVATVLAEGTLMGAVALGAPARTVRALMSRGDAYEGVGEDAQAAAAAAFASALAGTLPTPTHRVRVQGDMTVVATGLPSAKLTAFFDAAADRESSGAATIWRISDASVRKWLDAGRSPEELLFGFAEFCDDELPQPLRYLIEDAARRHGLVDVITARSVVVAADAALGAELAALPALLRLGVRRITDTVLVMDAMPTEVLSALRFAGYLPSAHNADGSLTVANVAAPRASAESVAWM